MPGHDRMVDTNSRSPIFNREGWELKTSLGFSYTRREKTFLDGSLSIDYLMHCLERGYSLNIVGNGTLKSNDGDIYQQAASAGIRFDYRLAKLGESNSLWLGTVGTFYHDKPLDVIARGTVGLGPRLLSLFGSNQNDFSIFLIPEYTSYDKFEDQYNTRLSFRETMSIPIGSVAKFVIDGYYIPEITNWKDFRVDVAATVAVKVAEIAGAGKFELGVRAGYIYNTKHIDMGLDPHDISTQLTLAFITGRKSEPKK